MDENAMPLTSSSGSSADFKRGGDRAVSDWCYPNRFFGEGYFSLLDGNSRRPRSVTSSSVNPVTNALRRIRDVVVRPQDSNN